MAFESDKLELAVEVTTCCSQATTRPRHSAGLWRANAINLSIISLQWEIDNKISRGDYVVCSRSWFNGELREGREVVQRTALLQSYDRDEMKHWLNCYLLCYIKEFRLEDPINHDVLYPSRQNALIKIRSFNKPLIFRNATSMIIIWIVKKSN